MPFDNIRAKMKHIIRKGEERPLEQSEWEKLTPEEKKRQLFLSQKDTLDKFVARNAISQKQYEKSLGDLIKKMGMEKEIDRSRPE